MVYVFLADGFETIEALAVVDMLRRAKIDNETVGVTGKTVKSSHNIQVVADITIDELNIMLMQSNCFTGRYAGYFKS